MRANRIEETHSQRRRNFFRSGELHLVILALLSETPRHGYELLAELQSRFNGNYRPSPGSIYPALNALESEQLVLTENDGDRRIYQLSPSGQKALEARRALLAGIEARTSARLSGDNAERLLAEIVHSARTAVRLAGLKATEAVLTQTKRQLDALQDEAGNRT